MLVKTVIQIIIIMKYNITIGNNNKYLHNIVIEAKCFYAETNKKLSYFRH